MPEMKIGLVCPYDMFKGGGVQECVIALELELTKRGHEVTVLAPRPRKTGPTPIKNLQLLGGAADFKAPSHTTFPVSAAIAVKDIDALLAEKNFDVLHFHEPEVPYLLKQIISRSNCANVATFHAKSPGNFLTKTISKAYMPYVRSLIKSFHTVTAVSAPASEFISSIGLNPTIVPNGVDLNKYRPAKKPNNQKSILYVGRLEKRKGVQYLIRAFARLVKTDMDLKLIIAGDGPDKAKLKEYCKTNKIPNVEFLGFISDKKKINLMQSATVFCSPALFGESFGIVLLEAMATDTPVVAGDNDGYSSVLVGAGSKSLIDPTNIKDFAATLDEFINNQQVRQDWLRWSKKYVKSFDYPRITDKYETVYRAAIKNHKKLS